jgi:uncharacterized membrane protein
MNTRLVIGPNASLDVRTAVLFMAGLGGLWLVIGGFFAWRGYWPILPFAGLELLALAAALAVSLRRNRYREVLCFEDERIRIEVGELGKGVAASRELPRSATRVLLARGPYRNSPTQLWLSCAGQTIELGRCLADDDKDRLAARIRELVHPAWPGAGGSSGPVAARDGTG